MHKSYVVAPIIAPEAPAITAVETAAPAAALAPAIAPTPNISAVKINLLFGALGSLQGMVETFVPDFPGKIFFSQTESWFTKQKGSPL